MSPSENVIADIASAFTTPIYALPLDAFRVLAGQVPFSVEM